MSDKEDLVSIGRIVNSFGKEGEVKVQLLTDFPERFQSLSEIILSCNGKDRNFSASVKEVKYHKDFVILKLDIFQNIEEARAHKGFFICLDKDDIWPLPEDSFYLFELLGLKVYAEDGRFLGILKDIYKLPAHDVFLIVNGEKELLVPALKKFVSRILPEEERIVISREGALTTDGY